jgi:hypothetical protein
LDEVHVIHRSWLAAAVMAIAGAVVVAVGAGPQMPASAVSRVEASTDIAWLERIASSAEAARDAQGQSRIGQPKALRIAAYARLGALGTPDSLAAIERVERTLTAQPLTPPTVTLDHWPAIGLHMGDAPATLVAQISASDGTTYGVVPASLLGGRDFFLVSTRSPDDATTWSRPKLIAPAASFDYRDTMSLAWAGPRRLVFTIAARTLPIALDEVERDSDGDGWTDLEEARLGTNPRDRDSDGDGLPDGRDVCPLFARPAIYRPDEATAILQKAILAVYAVTGSRDLLYVTPGSPRVHVAGYGGPILLDRPVPKDGNGEGGTWVSWKIARRDATTALVELIDWEGLLAAGGTDVRLTKIGGVWVVVSVRGTWVS